MRIHSGQKPFVCPKCPKTFISKCDLTRHAVIHTGEKPFACNFCHLTFGRRDKLLRHEKTHFPQENSRDNGEELQMLRGNVAVAGYRYSGNGKEVPSRARMIGNKRDNDGATTAMAEEENMVIDLDPFNHDGYNNLDGGTGMTHSDVASAVNSEMENGSLLPSVPDHIKNDLQENNLLTDRDYPHVPEHITGDSFRNYQLDENEGRL